MSEGSPMFDQVDASDVSPMLDPEHMEQAAGAGKKKSRKSSPAATTGDVSKLKCALALEGKALWFHDETKRRGIKEFEWSDVIAEALTQVPESFWIEKLESLTPLEFRINEALENPELRAKLSALLMGKDLPH